MGNGNFFAALLTRIDENREKPFLTAPYGPSFSYGEIEHLSQKIAGALLHAGLRSGDRIVVQVDKSPANVALYLAAMRVGIIYVPLNTAYTADEVTYFLNDAEATAFICDPAHHNTLQSVGKRANIQVHFTLDANGGGSLIEAADCATPYNDIQTRHKDDLAVILYTSGTTGRSKGAMLSHDNLQSNALALISLWKISADDVLLHALPIFHIHGLFVALHTAMLSACEVLFLQKFDVSAVRNALPRASVMMGVPTFYSRLLADPSFSKDECAHMRLFISGSAPLTEDMFYAFETRTGHRILERYGMSEAGMIASNPLIGDRLAGTVGFALRDVGVRISDDDGQLAPQGAPGNVEVKGPNIFKGYWRNPQKTAEDFTEDGFFKTGDIGALDAAGRLTLMGRSKDLIIAGGYNIYPKEIEQALDAIEGVAESAVIGAPHPDMGEGVVAILVTETQEVDGATIDEALKSLANFKRPRKVRWLNALPRNAMGKVQKQFLREQFKDIYTKDS